MSDRRRPDPPQTRGGEEGVALMLVVWLIVVLGFLAAGVTASTRSGTDLAENLRGRAAARYAAESGLVAARARIERVLAENPGRRERARALRDPGDLVADLDGVEIPGARFTVTATDLAARLDLNHAGREALVTLFRRFTSESGARRAAAALQDWRDDDTSPRPDGAEAPAYRSAGLSFLPADGALQRIEELPRVMGVDEALASALAPYVTVRGHGSVNLNTAPEPVLAALPGVGPSVAADLVARRERGETFPSTSVVTTARDETRGPRTPDGRRAQHAPVTVVPGPILLVSRGRAPGHPLTREIQATYAVMGDRLELRSWEERDL